MKKYLKCPALMCSTQCTVHTCLSVWEFRICMKVYKIDLKYNIIYNIYKKKFMAEILWRPSTLTAQIPEWTSRYSFLDFPKKIEKRNFEKVTFRKSKIENESCAKDHIKVERQEDLSLPLFPSLSFSFLSLIALYLFSLSLSLISLSLYLSHLSLSLSSASPGVLCSGLSSPRTSMRPIWRPTAAWCLWLAGLGVCGWLQVFGKWQTKLKTLAFRTLPLPIPRAGHFWYFWTFSTIKNDLS